MLKIEIRKPKPGVCSECGDTGIVIPKGGVKRVIEVGTFCDKCPEGARLWQETLKRLDRETNS